MKLSGPRLAQTAARGLILVIALLALSVPSATAQTIHVDIAPTHAIKFDPDAALGSSMDILQHSQVDTVYSEPVLKESLSAGWGPITYRLNTELTVAAWHWNPNGTWSDAAHQSGYFTGSAEPTDVLRNSFGYPLPHRGNTRGDDSSDKFSRLTDGDPGSYWKSNPYLTKRFTKEDDALHPQWIVVDFEAVQAITAIRIAWANPYARKYTVQYWTGGDALDKQTSGLWSTFPSGEVQDGKGGAVLLKLSSLPVFTRYLRIWMTESSNTCDTHGSGDPRNCVGYAVDEIYAGNFTASGAFVDLIVHAAGQNQTPTFVSSMDPWHSAVDIDQRRDQTGFDLFFTSGVTNHLPAMIPVSLLYGYPEDAVAELSDLEKRGYPISYVEIGEEPDGKKTMPEDYGALYVQWADALHRLDPKLKLGGPIFEGVNEDIKVWPDSRGRTSWMGRFVDYLKEHGRLAELAFVSFEHYPFDPCDITWKDLYSEPRLMKHILQVWRDDGVPKTVPLMVTESHVSWSLTGPMTTIFGALWLADNIGSFFEGGGAAFYHSPIQPQGVQNTCLGWSSWSNFVSDENYTIKGYTATYFAARMINLEWVQHRAGPHQMFPSAADVPDAGGNSLVTSYAVRRPDGTWSLMLVNRDENNPHAVRVVFEDAKSKRQASFSGPVTLVSFGSEQYVWINDGPNSHPDPDHPPVATLLQGPPPP